MFLSNVLQAKLGKALNLKEHMVGKAQDRSVPVYGPADLEGHLAYDGRYYVLDVARLFPPEKPDPKMR